MEWLADRPANRQGGARKSEACEIRPKTSIVGRSIGVDLEELESLVYVRGQTGKHPNRDI